MFGRTARTIDGVEYAPGKKFRVLREGASLTGWVPDRPGSSRGWRQDLQVGDIITCTGYGPGMGSDPGYGVEFMSDAAQQVGGFHLDFRPMDGSMWNYHPAPGYLEPVEE